MTVLQAIFASETIQDIIPLASNAILILGQVEGIQGSKVYVTKLVAFDFLIPMVLFVIISHVMSCGCLQGDRALAGRLQLFDKSSSYCAGPPHGNPLFSYHKTWNYLCP
ncbi:hypothetical protein ACSBR2_041290 [Camellia fascicularis]